MAGRHPIFACPLIAILVCILSPLTMSAAARQASTKIVSFPQQSQATSPDARYIVIGEHNSEPFHTAILEDRVLKTRRKLFNYDRHIDLLWSPDSRSFAVTDYEESDYSRCSIVFTDQTVPTIQVWDRVVKTVSERERKSLFENDHVYIAAVQWISVGALKLKVWGYGKVNASGFTRFYRYDKDGTVERLKN